MKDNIIKALQPDKAIISDSNPELINMYRQVADNVESVIYCLKKYKNTEDMFYEVRSQRWTELPPEEAAARMIYLNKTCFNGLYRVNRKGEFNVPYGKYKNPTICDEDGLREASKILKKATIICGDYLEVLNEYCRENDFVFLDPPYVPISEYSDFKRYTKEQFYEKDQRILAAKVDQLYNQGTNIILTNSNAKLVHELYDKYPLQVIKTHRHISSKAKTRRGEDVIVMAFPTIIDPAEEQIEKYPATRYMGSKSKLLNDIWNQAKRFKIESAIDLFAGSGIVGYMFKAHGLKVISCDHMYMSHSFTEALIENNKIKLSNNDIEKLLLPPTKEDHFVENNFKGLYFHDEDNRLIDTIRCNIPTLHSKKKQAIAMSALIRACMKKRPRGLFTYVGLDKYDDGRRDLQISFEQQFREAIDVINNAVFDNGKENKSLCKDALSLKKQADLVYIDPPYYSEYSDNHYVRRYHFVEGLARNWEGVEIQQETKTKKFKNYESEFATKEGAEKAFNQIFKEYKDSVLIVSYSSNCYPDQNKMVEMMQMFKEYVEVVPIDYTYSFGNQKDAATHRNRVQEYLFVGYDGEEVLK